MSALVDCFMVLAPSCFLVYANIFFLLWCQTAGVMTGYVAIHAVSKESAAVSKNAALSWSQIGCYLALGRSPARLWL